MPPVPRLLALCKKVLQSNVALITDVGDTPYEMIRDVLPACSIDQLREIEDASPHIALADEEIWEAFFKRDFPLVAEARGLSDTTATASAAPGDQLDAFFNAPISFRDLYYDEQIAREERLASAGSRLKERIEKLKAQKESRRAILDPRLAFLKKRGRSAKGSARHWSQREYKPRTLADKARSKASAIALAYTPPKGAARQSSVRIAIQQTSPERSKPTYTEPQAFKALPPIIRPPSFVERKIVRPAEHKPKAQPTVTPKYAGPRSLYAPIASAPKAAPEVDARETIPAPTYSMKPIPGVKRKAIPTKVMAQHECQTTTPSPSSTTGTSADSVLSPVESVTAYSSQTAAAPSPITPNVTMYAPPPGRKPPPSLFIPRKRAKAS